MNKQKQIQEQIKELYAFICSREKEINDLMETTDSSLKAVAYTGRLSEVIAIKFEVDNILNTINSGDRIIPKQLFKEFDPYDFKMIDEKLNKAIKKDK